MQQSNHENIFLFWFRTFRKKGTDPPPLELFFGKFIPFPLKPQKRKNVDTIPFPLVYTFLFPRPIGGLMDKV